MKLIAPLDHTDTRMANSYGTWTYAEPKPGGDLLLQVLLIDLPACPGGLICTRADVFLIRIMCGEQLHDTNDL